MAVLLSVEEVQTVLSLIAKERIQRESDERHGIKKFFRSHVSRGDERHVNNPAHSKVVLNCSGNTNRAELTRSVPF